MVEFGTSDPNFRGVCGEINRQTVGEELEAGSRQDDPTSIGQDASAELAGQFVPLGAGPRLEGLIERGLPSLHTRRDNELRQKLPLVATVGVPPR